MHRRLTGSTVGGGAPRETAAVEDALWFPTDTRNIAAERGLRMERQTLGYRVNINRWMSHWLVVVQVQDFYPDLEHAEWRDLLTFQTQDYELPEPLELQRILERVSRALE